VRCGFVRIAVASALMLVLVVSAGDARAQDSAKDSASVMPTEPTAAPERPSYLEYRRNELKYLAKRSRTGLISGSAATAVGVAFVAPAIVRECVRITSSPSVDDFRCTNAGKALLGVGAPILIGGVTTLLVTGIMFGVRKGKIRSIDDRLVYEKYRAVHWDPARSVFVF